MSSPPVQVDEISSSSHPDVVFVNMKPMRRVRSANRRPSTPYQRPTQSSDPLPSSSQNDGPSIARLSEDNAQRNVVATGPQLPPPIYDGPPVVRPATLPVTNFNQAAVPSPRQPLRRVPSEINYTLGPDGRFIFDVDWSELIFD